MGIYPRLAAALLILLVASVEAATRQTVNHGQTARNIISGQSAVTGNISTPAGSAAYFGSAYTSYHTAGLRFNTGDKVPGSSSGSGSGSGSGAKQGVKITPGVIVNKTRAAAMAKNAIKGGGIPGLLTTLAVGWALDQLPGASISGGELVMTPQVVTEIKLWDRYSVQGSDKSTDPVALCSTFWANGAGLAAGQTWDHVQTSPSEWVCRAKNPFHFFDWVREYTVTCPTGFDASGGCSGSPPAPQPFTESNYADLQTALASMNNNDWLQDLIKGSCEGSLNPDGCYDSLVDNPFVIGPASQTGTPHSTTTTTTSPDITNPDGSITSGTTSTTTTTVTPSYNYNYGGNYYDFTTTNTTTTNNDGKVTTTVTTDTSSGEPQEDPASEDETEEDTDFGGEYSDAPFAEVTPFYEQKYPDGLQGVWDSASAQLSSSDFLQFLQSFVPSFSGTCPAWSLSFNIMPGAMFGTFDFMSLCYVFDFVKIILMATAVFYARSLMFGG